jgi:hypothetical protein
MKAKLSTSPYNAERAHNELSFIKKTFIPPGKADPGEHEGGEQDEAGPKEAEREDRLNRVAVRILLPPSMKPNTGAPEVPMTTTVHSDHVGIHIDRISPAPEPMMPTLTQNWHLPRIKLLLPKQMDKNSHMQVPKLETVSFDCKKEELEEIEWHTFCPLKHGEHIIKLVKAHFCAHHLIPGYSAPTRKGIREWAVKQMYEFCHANDLQETWDYLWENWYRPGRWEIWARSCNPEIPILKTTIILESQSVYFFIHMKEIALTLHNCWCRIKRDFLHHFHKPRLDLLVWILIA